MSGLDVKVPEEVRYDRYFSVFDFEAMAAKTPSETVEQGKTLHATHLDPGKVQQCVLHELKQNVYFWKI